MSTSEIKSNKILIREVFENWYRIPEYQRPYVWGPDQINNLMDDLSFALTEKPESEYFLGTYVFQFRPAGSKHGQKFDENDLLDGQQRMTTLLLLFAVIRDLSSNPQMKSTCQECIYQRGNPFKSEPERMRLVFEAGVRESAKEFIDRFIKTENGTQQSEAMVLFSKNNNSPSIKNMINAILTIRSFWSSERAPKMEDFLKFLLTRVLMIYVATEDMEDAFRLFTILNDRGVQLRNSDILKSINLGAVDSDDDKIQYAKIWEDAESKLGDGFDRFLNFIRTILLKEKARLSLLKEFEDKIYDPKEKDKNTGRHKTSLLKKGQETFDMIKIYLECYSKLFDEYHDEELGNFAFDNLLKVMNYGLPSSDWIPPLLFFYSKFTYDNILIFLKKLNRKFSGDWIAQYSPTDRIEGMNTILRKIEQSQTSQEVIDSDVFNFDKDSFVRTIEANIYGRRFAHYIVLMLDYELSAHEQKMNFEKLAIEHILPQNPNADSLWCHDFPQEQRDLWTDKLGNLVIITGNKNASLGRLEYTAKKERYFKSKIPVCHNLARIYQKYSTWTPTDLEANHKITINEIKTSFGIENKE